MSIYSTVKKASMALSPLKVVPGLSGAYHAFEEKLVPRKPVYIKAIDGRVYVDHHDQSIGLPLLLYGNHEPYLCEAISRVVKPGMVCADVGANIGLISMVMARSMKGYGEIYSFEPHPDNYKLLCKNLALNNVSNVTTVNSGLSDEVGEAVFYVDRANSGGHSIVEKTGESIRVKLDTLDNYFAGRGIDVLKVDTQGADGLIVKGGHNLLSRYGPDLFLEFWPHALDKTKVKSFEFLEILHSLNYFIWMMDDINKKLVSLSDQEIVDRSALMNHVVPGMGYSSLYCAKLGKP